MSICLLFSLVAFLSPHLVLSERHVIHVPSSSLLLSSLTWDPISSHFIVASSTSPSILAVSDAGVVEHIQTDRCPSISSTCPSVAAITIDSVRRRLIVAFSNPNSVAAYDIKSNYKRFFETPLTEINGELTGVAVDLRTGDIFITGSKNNRPVILTVGLNGDARVLSEFEKYGDEGLGSIVHVSIGYLLVVQPATGKIFRVDSEDGATKEVLSTSSSANQLAPSVHSLSLHHDLSLLVSSTKTLLLLKSGDSWSEAGIKEKIILEQEETAVGVTTRDGKTPYVLLRSESGEYRIEEVTWGSENEMVWGFVLLGLGLCYFMFWRFQMGKLASSMNKKRN